MTKKKQVTKLVRVTEGTHALAESIAEVTEKSIGDVVSEAVAVYPNNLPDPIRSKIVLMVKHKDGNIEINPEAE